MKKKAAHGVDLQSLCSTIRFSQEDSFLKLILTNLSNSSGTLALALLIQTRTHYQENQDSGDFSLHMNIPSSLVVVTKLTEGPLCRYGEALVRLRRGLRSGETGGASGEERLPPCSGLASPRDSGSTVVEEI